MAAWLNLCEHKPATSGGMRVQQYFKANGKQFWFAITKQPDSRCEHKQLDLNIEDIRWTGLISREKSSRINKRIILQGTPKNTTIRISEIIADRPERSYALSDTLGIARNLLTDFTLSSFGHEERAGYTVNDRVIQLNCRSGKQPAGILLDAGNKKPGSNMKLKMSLSYSSQAPFQLGMADEDRFENGDPVVFVLPPADTIRTMDIPYNKIDITQNIKWSVICPQQDAIIRIDRFQLLPAYAADRNTGRDLWIWKPESWRNKADKLIVLLNKYNAKRVFISVEMDESKGSVLHTRELGKFIAMAGKHAIDVWAVEGDPHATLPDGQTQFANRAKILQQYNQLAAKQSRLSGVQYDIEPYLVNGWSLEQEQWFNAYLETIERIKRELNLPIEIAIPFWWQFKSVNNASLLDAVAPHIDSINVMNYRTDPALIKQFAQPFLEWGIEAEKQVSIALEAGPIPDEQRWHFRNNKPGSLWLVKDFSIPLLILLDKDMPSKVADTFMLYREGTLAGDVVSFQKDPDKLIELLPQLESLWRQWSSFAGVSLHGFEDELYKD